jgi:hypothetical protein
MTNERTDNLEVGHLFGQRRSGAFDQFKTETIIDLVCSADGKNSPSLAGSVTGTVSISETK